MILATPTYSMESRRNSFASSVDELQEDTQQSCKDFSRRIIQAEPAAISSTPTQPDIETMQIPHVALPGTSRYNIGTHYTSPIFPEQNNTFIQGSAKCLRLDGDEKGVRDTATSYLHRLILDGKLASALEPNPERPIETKDPKAGSRFAQALTEITNNLYSLLTYHTQQYETLLTNQRQALMTHTDDAELILTALTEIPKAHGSLSDKDIRAICTGLKKTRQDLTRDHRKVLKELEAQKTLLNSLELRVRAQHPDPSTVQPVSPTLRHITVAEFLTYEPTPTTPCQTSPRTTRRTLEAQLAEEIDYKQKLIDELRLREGQPSTPRTKYIKQPTELR